MRCRAQHFGSITLAKNSPRHSSQPWRHEDLVTHTDRVGGGGAGPIKTDGFVPPGSVNPRCTYRSPGHATVSTGLYVTGAVPVDAAAEYSMYSGENDTALSGLGLASRCLTDLHGAQDRPYDEVVVLLDGNRLFEAEGLDTSRVRC